MKEVKSVRVLDAPLARLTLTETVRLLADWANGILQRRIVTANPEMIVAAHKDEELFHIIRTADLVTADGAGLLWAASLKRIKNPRRNPPVGGSYRGRHESGIRNKVLKSIKTIFQAMVSLCVLVLYSKKLKQIIPERVSGSDLLPEVLKSSEQSDKRVYFLGSTDSVLAKLEEKIKREFPHLMFQTSHGLETRYKQLTTPSPNLSLSRERDLISSPPSKGERKREGVIDSNQRLINAINSFHPDILLVAFGIPKQEKWIYWNLQKFPSVRVALGVGGALDFFSGSITRAPQWLRTLNLEWLWRFARQPWRLPRIINATARFIRLVLQSQLRQLRGEMRPNVVCVVIRSTRKGEWLSAPTNNLEVFIAQRSDEPDHWQFPQGGVEKGETPENAALRELREEIGLSTGRVIGRSPHTHAYTWETPHFLGYVGQTQSICYVEADDDFVPKLNHDFIDYKWVSMNELLTWLHPVRREVGEIVVKDLTDLVGANSVRPHHEYE